MSTVTSFEELSSSQGRIGDSFGLAAWITVLGVLLSWWFLKSGAPVEDVRSLSATSVLSAPLVQADRDRTSATEQGDIAFAAGDIVDPPGDSALHYYQTALAESPDDAQALRGIAQVIEYLLNESETAIFHSDFDLARENAAKVLAIVPDNAHALDINARAARFKRVEETLDRAVALYAAGQLTEPVDENAALLYQSVLELDPTNEAARQGLDLVVQRTIANAESAMFAGNSDLARHYLGQAKAINPTAPGIDRLRITEQNMTSVAQDKNTRQTLQQAAEALQADHLMPPAQPNAYDLYQSVLAADPASDAALRGLQLVRAGLLERARATLAGNDPEAALQHLAAAEQAGASAAGIAELRTEAGYRQRLLRARAGQFDSLYPISDLEPVRQNPPEYPRNAPRGAHGTVELHMTVTEIGDVRDVEVIGNPQSYFERAAVQAVNGWRFKPVLENGRPIPVRVAVRMTFATQ